VNTQPGWFVDITTDVGVNHLNEAVEVSEAEVFALLLHVNFVIALGQDSNGMTHQPMSIFIAGADTLSTSDKVVFVWNSARQQNSAVHLGRIQSPVRDSDERHLVTVLFVL